MTDTPTLDLVIADVDGRFWERHPELGNRKLDLKQDGAELHDEWNGLLRDRIVELVRMMRDQGAQAQAIDLGA